jgi:hypothetical protein
MMLTQGIPVKLFDADNTAAPVNSVSHSIPIRTGNSSSSRPIGWAVRFAVAPSAVSIQLQGAFNDVDAEYAQMDICTNINGEMRTVSLVLCKFVRARVVSRTGGSGVTVEVMI